MARRNYLVKSRIAKALSDGEWHGVESIKNKFLTEGWSFINAKQLQTLAKGCRGVEMRYVGNERMYRLQSPSVFYQWLES